MVATLRQVGDRDEREKGGRARKRRRYSMVARSRCEEGGHEQGEHDVGTTGHAWGLGQSGDLHAAEEQYILRVACARGVNGSSTGGPDCSWGKLEAGRA